MKCPHCLEAFFEEWKYASFPPGARHYIRDKRGCWVTRYCTCPGCEKIIIELGKGTETGSGWEDRWDWVLAEPKAISRPPLPPAVSPEFACDYKEGCLTLADSVKASAALSRRCLQNLLTEKAGTTKTNLADQIQEVIDSKQLPSYLSKALDAVRNIGNFAAHPIKSKSTGEIVEVEPGEAEWNLDILERLFDFYFVQEEVLRKKREKLNQKLKDAGKPPMK